MCILGMQGAGGYSVASTIGSHSSIGEYIRSLSIGLDTHGGVRAQLLKAGFGEDDSLEAVEKLTALADGYTFFN
jgi:hypothetical protein